MNVLGSKPVTLTPTTGEAPDRRSVEEVAREFEAMLLAQMLRQLRDTLAASEEDDEAGLGLGDQTMAETIDVELARQLSKAGGIGLARELKQSMMRTMTPGTAAPAQPAPAETESPSGPVVIPTPIRGLRPGSAAADRPRRPAEFRVRLAGGPVPRHTPLPFGNRPESRLRTRGSGRWRGQGRVRRRAGRLRPDGRPRPSQRHADPLRAPVEPLREGWRGSCTRDARRARREHGAVHGTPPALRGARRMASRWIPQQRRGAPDRRIKGFG